MKGLADLPSSSKLASRLECQERKFEREGSRSGTARLFRCSEQLRHLPLYTCAVIALVEPGRLSLSRPPIGYPIQVPLPSRPGRNPGPSVTGGPGPGHPDPGPTRGPGPVGLARVESNVMPLSPLRSDRDSPRVRAPGFGPAENLGCVRRPKPGPDGPARSDGSRGPRKVGGRMPLLGAVKRHCAGLTRCVIRRSGGIPPNRNAKRARSGPGNPGSASRDGP